jgi:glycosyltransferase involved in cell wall biosynthesis
LKIANELLRQNEESVHAGRRKSPFDFGISPSASISKDEITVIIPTLNEEPGIGLVIDELRQAEYANLLVVDGYSSDRTVQVARERDVIAIPQHGTGKAGAIRTGIEHTDTAYMLLIDADRTYDPQDIEKLRYHARKYDEIIGVRKNRQNVPLLHRLGNRFVNFALNSFMGTNLSDVCSGLYMIRTDMARKLNLNSRGFDVEVEIAAQIAAAGGRITEVPIDYRERMGIKKLQTWKAGFRILATILSLFRSYNPVLLFSVMAGMLAIPGLILTLHELVLRYLYGSQSWSIGRAWLGLVLLVIGMQGFVVATISSLLRRLERRILANVGL